MRNILNLVYVAKIKASKKYRTCLWHLRRRSCGRPC